MEEHAIGLRRARANERAVLVAIDDDAGTLFGVAGIQCALPSTHPLVQAEAAAWDEALRLGRVFVAETQRGEPVGFSAWSERDGAPYLEQLDVRRAYMGQGIGTRLLEAAAHAAGEGPLWLTTYAHVPWNKPYYERRGFAVVPEAACGPEVRAVLAAQRAALPDGDQRVAMRRAARLP